MELAATCADRKVREQLVKMASDWLEPRTCVLEHRLPLPQSRSVRLIDLVYDTPTVSET